MSRLPEKSRPTEPEYGLFVAFTYRKIYFIIFLKLVYLFLAFWVSNFSEFYEILFSSRQALYICQRMEINSILVHEAGIFLNNKENISRDVIPFISVSLLNKQVFKLNNIKLSLNDLWKIVLE